MNPRTLTFGAAILLLLTVYVAGFTAVLEGRFNVNLLLQDYETDRALHAYTLTLEDMEAAQRGYLLTWEPGYLSAFKAADAHLDECERQMESDRPEMMNVLRSVIDAAKLKRDELRAPIRLAERNRVPEAIAVTKADNGFARMRAVRALTDNLHGRIKDEVRQLRNLLQSHRKNLDVLLPGAGLLSIVLFGVAFLGFVRQQRRGDAAMAKLRRTNDELFRSFADPRLLMKEKGIPVPPEAAAEPLQ